MLPSLAAPDSGVPLMTTMFMGGRWPVLPSKEGQPLSFTGDGELPHSSDCCVRRGDCFGASVVSLSSILLNERKNEE